MGWEVKNYVSGQSNNSQRCFMSKLENFYWALMGNFSENVWVNGLYCQAILNYFFKMVKLDE